MGLDLKRTPNYSSANNEVFKIYRESESYFILLITNEFIKIRENLDELVADANTNPIKTLSNIIQNLKESSLP